MYCTKCGNQIVTGSNYCPHCGTAVNTALTHAETTVPVTVPSIASSGSGDYRLIFVDRNQCSASDAEELIQDLLGYSAEDADQFVDLAPIEIADNLSALQARTLAQAFTEYGCQMSIMNENGDTVDLSEKATSSVFDEDGNLIAKAAMILGALTLVNQVTSYRRYKKPSLLERLFRPRYQPLPPKRRKPRFSLFHPIPKPAPKPKPVPRSHNRPSPAPVRRSNHARRGNMMGGSSRGHGPR